MVRQIVYCHVVQFAIQRKVFHWLTGWRGLTANMRPSGGREYHYGLQTAAIPAQPDGCRLRWLAPQEARSKPQEGHRVDILREQAHRNVIRIRAV